MSMSVTKKLRERIKSAEHVMQLAPKSESGMRHVIVRLDILCSYLDEIDADYDRLSEAVSDGEDNARKILAENARLKRLVAKQAKVLGVPDGWCYADCAREFGCREMEECPIDLTMRKLGIEVSNGD